MKPISASTILVLMLSAFSLGAADRSQPDAAVELHAAMYDFAVCEYCGLVTQAVYDGFHHQSRELIARARLSEQAVRRIRIRAWTDADLEHANRGLGGFRQWCRTEGAAAAARLEAYGGAGESSAAARR